MIKVIFFIFAGVGLVLAMGHHDMMSFVAISAIGFMVATS